MDLKPGFHEIVTMLATVCSMVMKVATYMYKGNMGNKIMQLVDMLLILPLRATKEALSTLRNKENVCARSNMSNIFSSTCNVVRQVA